VSQFLCKHYADIYEKLQIDRNVEHLLTRANEIENAGAILRTRAAAWNPIWMSSVVKKNVGKDVSLLVSDVQRYESTGQKWDNTWGNKGDKEANRRMANTMGYQLSH
jgi:hypothetical protein